MIEDRINEIVHYCSLPMSFSDVSEIFECEIEFTKRCFFNSENWKRLKERLSVSSKTFRVDHYLCDIQSDYALKLISEQNIHQPLDYFVIDWYRRNRKHFNGQLIDDYENSKVASYDIAKETESLQSLRQANLPSKEKLMLLLAYIGFSEAQVFSAIGTTKQRFGSTLNSKTFGNRDSLLLRNDALKKRISVLIEEKQLLKKKLNDQHEFTLSQALNREEIKTLKEYASGITRELTEKGVSSANIAKVLGVSPRTIRTYRKNNKG